MTLYRGDGFWNRRRRTYGLSWTSEREVAESFANRDWRTCEGGSVLLQTRAPPSAIICAPHLLDNRYGEHEYLVDRRLGRVTVLQRFSQLSIEEAHPRAARLLLEKKKPEAPDSEPVELDHIWALDRRARHVFAKAVAH